jgi:hypothetical protein
MDAKTIEDAKAEHTLALGSSSDSWQGRASSDERMFRRTDKRSS